MMLIVGAQAHDYIKTEVVKLTSEYQAVLFATCQAIRPDYLATVDVDPSSDTYSQVSHALLAFGPSPIASFPVIGMTLSSWLCR